MLAEQITKVKDLLKASSQVLITCHRSPDGDAIGSSLALYHYLVKKGINVKVMAPDDYPKFLQWMPGNPEVQIFDFDASSGAKTIQESDLIFSLDYNILSRTGSMRHELEKSQAPFIMIDHHENPGDYCEVTFSEPKKCSTAQMIFEFISAMGDEALIDADMGQCIYTGIMTDTGSFRFPSVTPETHDIAASLIRVGVNHAEIHRKVYDTNQLDRMRLIGYALSEKIEMLNSDSVSIIHLNQEELTKHNYRPGDTEGLVNQALSIESVQVAVFVREGNNQVKMSFRSKGSFNVAEFAGKYFNGGGHKKAAGGASPEPLNDVLTNLRNAFEENIEGILQARNEMDH